MNVSVPPLLNDNTKSVVGALSIVAVIVPLVASSSIVTSFKVTVVTSLRASSVTVNVADVVVVSKDSNSAPPLVTPVILIVSVVVCT